MKYTAAAALALLATCAHAQLQSRDFNGDGTIDAYYEASANLTWMANANAAAGAGIGNSVYGPGAASYTEAQSFLSGLDLFGVTGWRLPQGSFTATASTNFNCGAFFERSPGAGCRYTPSSTNNEFAHLMQSIGGVTSPFTNIGVGAVYWMQDLGRASPVWSADIAHYYSMSDGTALAHPAFSYAFVWGVREGDVAAAVAPVPEPSTYAMVGLGLLALTWRQRRAARRQ